MDQLQALKSAFIKCTKKIIKTNLSKNPEKLKQYEVEIIEIFNEFITFLKQEKEIPNNPIAGEVELIANYIRERAGKALVKLNSVYSIPISVYDQIILKVDPNQDKNTAEDLSNTTESKTETVVSIESDSDSQDSDSSFFDTVNASINFNMTNSLSVTEFLKLCSQMLNRNYSGDPLGLQAFINAIKLLKPIAASGNLNDYLVSFVKTKLEGKALESIPQNECTIDQIIQSLSDKIKPDNSKVIEGRLLALKSDNRNLTDFATSAEQLADSLKRSLIIEGVTEEKANEMVIDRTIEMCRTSARTDIVKSVISSSQFKSAKEVISKYIIEINRQQKDQQVLAYRSFNKNKNQNFQQNRNHNNNTNNRRQNSSHNSNFNNRRPNRRFNNNRNHNGRYTNNNNNNRTFDSAHQNNNFRNVRVTQNISGNGEMAPATSGQERLQVLHQ